MSRMKNWTKLTNEELWVQWRAMFNNDEEAIVTAIWISNRLVKDKEKSTRKKFYSLKDEWIAQHQGRLIIGKVVRDESRTCWRQHWRTPPRSVSQVQWNRQIPYLDPL